MNRLLVSKGDVFNSLTIVKEVEPRTIDNRRPKRMFLCKCVCDRLIKVRLDALRNNKKSSCGCQLPIRIVKTGNHILKHGFAKLAVYKIWKGIRRRCYAVQCSQYHNYGGRGIKMSTEWYISAKSFVDWSLKNGYKEGLELDRIDNNSGYFPENCRWTTAEVNANNKRTNIKYLYDGIWLTLPQISRRTHLGFPTLYRRINENKLSLEEALSIPLHGKCKKDRLDMRHISDNDALFIFHSHLTYDELAKRFNTSETTIWRIKKRINAYKILHLRSSSKYDL